MKNTKVFISSLTGLAVFVGALFLVSGCAGAGSPQRLADKALAPASSPEEEKQQEKAIIDLASLPPNDPGVREALRRVLEKSENPKIRTQAIRGLGFMKDKDSVPLFIKAIQSDDRTERACAYLAASQVLSSKRLVRDAAGDDVTIENADADARKRLADLYQKIYDLSKKKWDEQAQTAK